MTTPYTPAFYDAQGPESLESARRLLGHLFGHYRPRSVLDVGCGIGTWLAAAAEQGVTDLTGVDGDYVAKDELLFAHERFIARDVAQPVDLGRRFDLVISVEVAEHLPQQAAENFVDTLTRHGDLVLFSAALPYQGGTAHCNENWLEYWQALFARRGFAAIDLLRPALWHDDGIAWWYRQNCVLFRAETAVQRILPSWPATGAATLVHPEFLLRSVRRTPCHPLATSLADDLAGFATAGSTEPATHDYGREFDYQWVGAVPVADYDALKAAAPQIENPVLSDAIAPVAVR